MDAVAKTVRPSLTPSPTQLSGWKLIVARLGWGSTVVIVLLASLLSTLIYVNLWIDGEGLPFAWWNPHGLSVSIFYPLDFIVNGIIFWIYFLVALYFGWKHSSDWMILVASALWLTLAYVYGVALHRVTPLETDLYFIIDSISIGTALVFVGTFPNGKFAARWLRPIIALLILLALADNLARHNTGTGIFPDTVRTVLFGFTLTFAPIYRLSRANNTERQQMKLATLAIILNILAYILRHLVTPTDQTSWLALRLLIAFVLIISAMALIFALKEYRLWDVDFAINRSLVYGALTALLGAIFAALFFGLRVLAEVALGNSQNMLAIVFSTAVVVGLFTPARNKLRRFVDRRFYGIDLDYEKAVKQQRHRQKAARDNADTQTSFGSYNGLQLVGRGGMGEVYRAYSPRGRASVAIKILPEHLAINEETRKRFVREAETISRLEHPNIVTLHDFGERDGKLFMVMEYLDGQDVKELLKKNGRLPLDQALPYLHQIAAALDYAHAHGVVHRDIKPSNVMLAPEASNGNAGRAVLMDFGIAKVVAATTQLTKTGMVGTLDYVAPEQIQGAKDVGTPADIYSFGAMTFEMLTGELPFKHNNPGAMVMAHLMQPPPDPQTLVPELPFHAASAIVTALAKKPAARFPSALDFVNEMANHS